MKFTKLENNQNVDAFADTLQQAYDNAVPGTIIKTQDYLLDYTGQTLAFNSKDIAIEGGYYCDFASNAGRTTHIKGQINISSGKVTMKNIVLDK